MHELEIENFSEITQFNHDGGSNGNSAYPNILLPTRFPHTKRSCGDSEDRPGHCLQLDIRGPNCLAYDGSATQNQGGGCEANPRAGFGIGAPDQCFAHKAGESPKEDVFNQGLLLVSGLREILLPLVILSLGIAL